MAASLLAKMQDATLVTGDNRLNKLAIASGLTVHGALWLLDQMVDFKALEPGQAVAALTHSLERGARLPANECRHRLIKWSS